MKNQTLFLRALESDDLDILYSIENREEDWYVSQTQTPFSKATLKDYISNAHLDIYTAKQLRLVVCLYNATPVGFVDFFDFCPKNKRAGVGIILSPEHRGKGYSSQSLSLLMEYAKKHLHVHQLYAHILENNLASIQCFTKCGFQKTAVLQDWFFDGKCFQNVGFYQLFFN